MNLILTSLISLLAFCTFNLQLALSQTQHSISLEKANPESILETKTFIGQGNATSFGRCDQAKKRALKEAQFSCHLEGFDQCEKVSSTEIISDEYSRPTGVLGKICTAQVSISGVKVVSKKILVYSRREQTIGTPSLRIITRGFDNDLWPTYAGAKKRAHKAAVDQCHAHGYQVCRTVYDFEPDSASNFDGKLTHSSKLVLDAGQQLEAEALFQRYIEVLLDPKRDSSARGMAKDNIRDYIDKIKITNPGLAESLAKETIAIMEKHNKGEKKTYWIHRLLIEMKW